MAGLFASGRRTEVALIAPRRAGGFGRGPFKAGRVISAARWPPRPPRRRAQCAGAPRRHSAGPGTRRRRRDTGAAAAPARPPRPQSPAAARRPHTPPPQPPWAPEVPGPAGLEPEALRGAAAGSRGRGLLRFGEAGAGGCPTGRVGRRFPVGEGMEVAGPAEEEGGVRFPARPALRPLPALRGRGRPWVCLGPLLANVAGPRLECNWTCLWGWPGEREGGWTGPLQVGLCEPGGCAGAWHRRVGEASVPCAGGCDLGGWLAWPGLWGMHACTVHTPCIQVSCLGGHQG